MVFGFVRQSGGHVEVWSEEGSGSVVQMYFPRSLEPECFDEHSELAPHSGGQETILVVEDNEGVRLTVVELLEQAGYTVLTAEDGDRAMQALQNGVQPDLIFTDVVMPGRVKVPTWPTGRACSSHLSRCCSPPATPATCSPPITC